MIVFGVSGKAGHGKDFVAKRIQAVAKNSLDKNIGFFPLALPLKARVYAELSGEYTYEEVFHTKPEEVRKLLQEVGTERGRDIFGMEFWTRQVHAFLRYFTETMPFLDGLVVPDVRFPNELELVQFGGRVSADVHKSAHEAAVRAVEYTPEREAYLLDHDVQALLELDASYYRIYNEIVGEEAKKAPGLPLYVISDRPTLTGEAAQHISETALDGWDKTANFGGIIENWMTTTIEELDDQLLPHVRRMLA